MRKSLVTVVFQVKTDVFDNIQGAEHRREKVFGDESLSEQVANDKVDLCVEQDFSDFRYRGVRQVNNRVFKKFQIAHACLLYTSPSPRD